MEISALFSITVTIVGVMRKAINTIKNILDIIFMCAKIELSLLNKQSFPKFKKKLTLNKTQIP